MCTRCWIVRHSVKRAQLLFLVLYKSLTDGRAKALPGAPSPTWCCLLMSFCRLDFVSLSLIENNTVPAVYSQTVPDVNNCFDCQTSLLCLINVPGHFKKKKERKRYDFAVHLKQTQAAVFCVFNHFPDAGKLSVFAFCRFSEACCTVWKTDDHFQFCPANISVGALSGGTWK